MMDPHHSPGTSFLMIDNWKGLMMINAPTTADRDNTDLAAVPSPAEIRDACLEIQQGWSASERQRRAGRSHEDATSTLIPVVRLSVPNRRIA